MSYNYQHAVTRKYKPKRGRVVLAVFSVMLLTVVSLMGFNGWLLNTKLKDNSVKIVAENVKPGSTPPPAFTTIKDGFTMVIVGNDSGDGDPQYGQRTAILNDVNIVLHLSPGWEQATVLAFPRDTFVDFEPCTDPETGVTHPGGVDKLNSALSRGGLNCVVQTLNNITGQNIDKALMVGFKGVIELSNAVGGVEVCTTEPIDDPHANLHLDAGTHTLQGDQALAFLRTRYGVGDGSDLSRISNQQIYLSSLLRTIKSKDTLTNINKVYNLANAVANNAVLSENLTDLTTLANIAYSLKDLNLDKVNFVQVPTHYSGNGVEITYPAAEDLFVNVFTDQQIKLTGGTGSVGSINEGSVAPTPLLQIEAKTGIIVEETPIPAPVEISDQVTGQNANDKTCSRGYSG